MIPIINHKETGVNLRILMDAKKLTVKQVQEYLGLASVQSIYHWLNGVSMPTIDNLYALSELFGVTIDDMIIGNMKKAKALDMDYEFDNPCVVRLFTYYKRLQQGFAA